MEWKSNIAYVVKLDYTLYFTWTFFFPCPTEPLPREDIIHDNLQYLGIVFGLGFWSCRVESSSFYEHFEFFYEGASVNSDVNMRASLLKYNVRLIYNMNFSYILAVISSIQMNRIHVNWKIPVKKASDPTGKFSGICAHVDNKFHEDMFYELQWVC